MQVEDVYNQFYGELKNFIEKKVNDEDLAQDILHDIFFKLQKNRTLIPEPPKLKSWVYTVSRNAVIDHFRKAPVRVPANDNLIGPDNLDPDPDQEFLVCFMPFLNYLPDEDRQLIGRIDLAGERQIDVARELNISYSGLKSRVQRARDKMKSLFQQCCEIELDSRGQPIGCSPRSKC